MFNKQNTEEVSDTRYPQADKEACLTLFLYGVYFVWWYVCAYGLGGGDPEKYTYVFGFPSWFFYSCILGYPVLSLLLWIMVKKFFKNLPLDPVVSDGQSGDAIPNTQKSLQGPLAHKNANVVVEQRGDQ